MSGIKAPLRQAVLFGWLSRIKEVIRQGRIKHINFSLPKLIISKLSVIANSIKYEAFFCPKGIQPFSGRVRPEKRICLCESV